jgi:hypothetical protein
VVSDAVRNISIGNMDVRNKVTLSVTPVSTSPSTFVLISSVRGDGSGGSVAAANSVQVTMGIYDLSVFTRETRALVVQISQAERQLLTTTRFYATVGAVDGADMVITPGATLFVPQQLLICNGNLTNNGDVVWKSNITWCADNLAKRILGTGNIVGCTNPSAMNYNPDATKADPTMCIFSPLGCTYPISRNYNPTAVINDGSCLLSAGLVLGCRAPCATNFASNATMDDGSCQFPPTPTRGCTYGIALNPTPDATVDDGSCAFPEFNATIICASTAAKAVACAAQLDAVNATLVATAANLTTCQAAANASLVSLTGQLDVCTTNSSQLVAQLGVCNTTVAGCSARVANLTDSLVVCTANATALQTSLQLCNDIVASSANASALQTVYDQYVRASANYSAAAGANAQCGAALHNTSLVLDNCNATLEVASSRLSACTADLANSTAELGRWRRTAVNAAQAADGCQANLTALATRGAEDLAFCRTELAATSHSSQTASAEAASCRGTLANATANATATIASLRAALHALGAPAPGAGNTACTGSSDSAGPSADSLPFYIVASSDAGAFVIGALFSYGLMLMGLCACCPGALAVSRGRDSRPGLETNSNPRKRGVKAMGGGLDDHVSISRNPMLTKKLAGSGALKPVGVTVGSTGEASSAARAGARPAGSTPKKLLTGSAAAAASVVRGPRGSTAARIKKDILPGARSHDATASGVGGALATKRGSMTAASLASVRPSRASIVPLPDTVSAAALAKQESKEAADSKAGAVPAVEPAVARVASMTLADVPEPVTNPLRSGHTQRDAFGPTFMGGTDGSSASRPAAKPDDGADSGSGSISIGAAVALHAFKNRALKNRRAATIDGGDDDLASNIDTRINYAKNGQRPTMARKHSVGVMALSGRPSDDSARHSRRPSSDDDDAGLTSNPLRARAGGIGCGGGSTDAAAFAASLAGGVSIATTDADKVVAPLLLAPSRSTPDPSPNPAPGVTTADIPVASTALG